MAAPKTELSVFVTEQIKKYEGVMVPVKASVSERMVVRKVSIEKLHPNPDDEFCSSEVGPNYSIYNKYVKAFQRFGSMDQSVLDEPITVQKVHPDGYMILNGHHRWAAALRVGIKMIPVKIVNLTSEVDIQKMLRSSTHDKRAALDLDEVVFCSEENDIPERPLPFPMNKVYVERIRLGLPALLHFLGQKGYDVWVYSSGYYSLDYIQRYFKKYSVKVDGVVTGIARKDKKFEASKKKTESMITSKYKETLHIDRRNVIRSFREKGDFEEHEIDVASANWSRQVMKIVHGFTKTENIK